MNEIVKTEPKKSELAVNFIEKIKADMSLVLPKVCTPERFARVAISCINKSPAMLQAIQTQEGKSSVARAMMTCAELGIEPDGRRAYLIPFKNNITLIFDYKGIVELVLRSGLVSNIHADVVCDNDEFEYNIGEIVKHKIDFKKPRGDAYAYYCVATFKDGTKKCEVMSLDEVLSIKKRSKSSNNGPWVTDFTEMAKKTVFKRLSKWLPMSPEVRKAIEVDNEDFRAERQAPEPVDIDYDDVLPLDEPTTAQEIAQDIVQEKIDQSDKELSEQPF